jgi:hypothetical protein
MLAVLMQPSDNGAQTQELGKFCDKANVKRKAEQVQLLTCTGAITIPRRRPALLVQRA